MAEKDKKKGGFFQAVKEFVYGMFAHDLVRFTMKTRASTEHLFILITMGDMLGVPILPPYYSLKASALRNPTYLRMETENAEREGFDRYAGLRTILHTNSASYTTCERRCNFRQAFPGVINTNRPHILS